MTDQDLIRMQRRLIESLNNIIKEQEEEIGRLRRGEESKLTYEEEYIHDEDMINISTSSSAGPCDYGIPYHIPLKERLK